MVRGSVAQARLLIDRLAMRGYRISNISEERLRAYATLLFRPRLMHPMLLHRWKIGKPGWAKGWVFNMVVIAMRRNRNE